MEKRGILISFEGPEKSGKTTQIENLARFLNSKGYSTVKTREPGGTQIGDEIRAIIRAERESQVFPETELFLFLASRAQHVRELVFTALNEGKIVLIDRFADSTFAYQGWGRGISLDVLYYLNNIATGGLSPNLTFLLDIDPQKASERLRENSDRIEEEAFEFHQRVRAGYLSMAKNAPPGRWIIIDATRAPEEIFAEIERVVIPRIQEAGIEPGWELKRPGLERCG